MRRLVFVPLLLLAAILSGCGMISLGYGQAPRILSWWADDYLDLDRAQSRQLDAALAELHDWHRREELPRLRELLMQADDLWGSDGEEEVTAEKLDAIEREAAAAMVRLYVRAAPLAEPLLASMRPEQWTYMRERQRERLDKWLERQSNLDERSNRFISNLERWLGSLERPLRELARSDAASWPAVDHDRLRPVWEARQRQTVMSLQTVAAGQREQGVAMLAELSERPADAELNAAVRASTLRVLNAASPAQRAKARALWAGWREELRQIELRSRPIVAAQP